MQHWYENTTQHSEMRINKLSSWLLWWIILTLKLFFMAGKNERQQMVFQTDTSHNADSEHQKTI